MTAATFLADLRARASTAGAEETAWRQEAARRSAALERARAHAFRRWAVLNDLSTAVQLGGDRDQAVACGVAQVRRRLGWPDEIDASRQAVLEALRPVAVALLDDDEPGMALATFEQWLDQPVVDTPVVDF